MYFGSTTFNGVTEFDSYWPDGTPATRWCGRCFKVIPQDDKLYIYGFVQSFAYKLCAPCHLAVINEFDVSCPCGQLQEGAVTVPYPVCSVCQTKDSIRTIHMILINLYYIVKDLDFTETKSGLTQALLPGFHDHYNNLQALHQKLIREYKQGR